MRAPVAITLAVALAAAPAVRAIAAPEGWSPLLSPAELSTILDAEGDAVRVLQVNGDHGDGYIPGAVRAPYAEWRGPESNPGALPETAQFHAILERTGIEAETPVVVVHAGTNPADFGSAARVYWTLKSLGVEDLAILDGGLAGWKAAGLATEADEGGVFPSAWTPELSDDWRVTSAELQAMIDQGDIANFVDARPPGFFEGLLWHDAASGPGTLPGSSNLTYEVWFDEDGRFVDAARAREIAESTGQTDAPLTVSFCNTGHWAAINWFALSELAGIDNTRLYAESMVGWSQAGGPMDNRPGRLQYYWLMFNNWLGGLFA